MTWSYLATIIRVGALMCLGTNVSGHNHVWAQTCLGTVMYGLNRVGTIMSGHKCVWAQSCLGIIAPRHKRVWAQTCVGTIMWDQSYMGTNVVEPSLVTYLESRTKHTTEHWQNWNRTLTERDTSWFGIFNRTWYAWSMHIYLLISKNTSFFLFYLIIYCTNTLQKVIFPLHSAIFPRRLPLR